MIDVAGPSHGSTHALRYGGEHLEVMFVVVAPDADTVAGDHLLGRLGSAAIELNVPGAHCGGGLRAGLEHAHGPYPGIDAYWAPVRLVDHGAF